MGTSSGVWRQCDYNLVLGMPECDYNLVLGMPEMAYPPNSGVFMILDAECRYGCSLLHFSNPLASLSNASYRNSLRSSYSIIPSNPKSRCS